MRIQIISLICNLSFLFILLHCIRKRKIQEAYALGWIILSLFFIVLSCSPKLLKLLAELFGIQIPSNALLLMMLTLSIFLHFHHLVLLSKNQVRIRILAQELALLKNKIDHQGKEK